MSKIEQKIISFLSDYPEKDFYNQEIAEAVHSSKAAASLLLNKLLKEKLVTSNARGNMKFYRVVASSLIIKQWRIKQAVEQLTPLAYKLKNESEKVILFGSACRGEQTASSDFDLLIISRKKEIIREVINKTKTKHKINAIIKTQSEFSELEIKEPEFFNEINRGLILYKYDSRI